MAFRATATRVHVRPSEHSSAEASSASTELSTPSDAIDAHDSTQSPVIWGDIWTQPRGILVHGCNAKGVMGAGAAKGFKLAFPRAFAQYRAAWERGALTLGHVEFCPLGEGLWGACAITQDRYGRGKVLGSLPAIQQAFARIKAFAVEHQLPVYYIRVGGGLAGGVQKGDGSVGGWETIHPVILQELSGVEHCLVEWAAPPSTNSVPSRATSDPISTERPQAAQNNPAASQRAPDPTEPLRKRIWGVKKRG